MTFRWKTALVIILGLLGIWFLYVERAILTPFILAAIFAYIFNPIITFVSEKFKLPRTIAILIVYTLIIGLFVAGTFILSRQVIEESAELRKYATNILLHAKTHLAVLPTWIRPIVYQLLVELEKSRFLSFLNSPTIFPYVSQAISRIISFLIFLFSGYYFLNDGAKMIAWAISFIPKKTQEDVEKLLEDISTVLGGYLRGEVFLIFLMGLVTYLALSILGIQFAASLAIFSGFAEIVPVVGPIVAASTAVLVALVTGHAHFGLSPINAAIIVILIYFVLRHLEDYFVVPYVMGRITKLPPFVIFFAVVAGGNLWGTLGLILAVPTAAILRLIIEFAFQTVSENES